MDHQTICGAFTLLTRFMRREAASFALLCQDNGAYSFRFGRKKLDFVSKCVAGLSLLALNAYALKPSFQGDPSYLIDYWETEDGLPEDSATAMVQTADGFLWFGTFNGLVRFDGVKFSVFNQQNTPELPSSSVVNLHLDKQGRLWISTYGGLVVHQGTDWKVLTHEVVNTGDIVRTFTERLNGDLLLTKFNGKVVEFSNGQLRDLPAPPGNPHEGYLGQVDEDGKWWVVQNKFIGSLNGNKWVPARVAQDISPSAPDQFGCAKARDGGLWILLDSELIKYSRGVQIARVHLREPPGSMWSMTEDSHTNVWISTSDQGICRVSPDGRMQRWNETNGLPYHGARFVFEDREGDLWIGTSGGGLVRFKPRRFQSFGTESGLTERVVKSVSPAPGGGLWIATYGKGLFQWSETGISNVPIPGWNNDLHGQSVLLDRAGRTWVGTYRRGLWVLVDGEVRRIEDNDAGGDNVIAIFEDSSSRVWTSGGQAVSAFTAGVPRCYGPKQGLPPFSVRCFGEDRNGTIWLSNLKGVFRLENDHFVEVHDNEGQSIPNVMCLKGDAYGRVWMGVENAGLLCWHKSSLSRLGTKSGLPASSIHSIIEDDQGFFWMPSNQGIVRAQQKELAAAAEGKRSRVLCQILDLSDGLPSLEFPSGQQPACARDAAGKFWFATAKGVAVTDPAAFNLQQQPLQVQIEEVGYHLRSEQTTSTEQPAVAPWLDHLELPAGSRRIEIRYTAPCFRAPEKVRFEVKLEGQDSTWVDVGTRRVAYFDELRPGKHLFRVRSCNSDGVWNNTGASLAFTVLPLFWQTAWFRTLEWSAAFIEALLILALLRAMSRRRVAKLALRERLDFEQLVSELSGIFINMPIERMDRQITEGLGKVAAQLGFDVASLTVSKGRTAEADVTFFWRADGVSGNLPELSNKSFPWSANELLQGREVCLPTLQRLPSEAMVDRVGYEKIGVRLVYQIPLSAEGAPLGSLSFCTVCKERALPAELLQRQRMVGKIFANALTRKFTENRRRESEARFRLAVDTSPNAIILADGKGRIVLANPQTETLFGYANGELVGQSVERLLAERFQSKHVAHREQFMASPQVREMGQGRVMLARRKDGAEFEAEIALNPIQGEQGMLVLTTIVDVTEKRKRDRALRDSEERMSLAAEAANLGMWIWDIAANTVWSTDKFRKLFGFSPDEKIDVEDIQQRLHHEDRANRQKALQQALERGCTYDVQYRLFLPGGTDRWMASHGRAELDNQGQPVRMLGVCIDITDRHRTEDQAREVSGRLITAQEDERTRLARELHDDLSQSLALLSVDLDLFGQQQPPGMGEGARERMEGLANQVRNLSSEVHRLSHELHPAKLEQLGLTAAMRSFCKDIAMAHNLAIHFEAREVPQIIPEPVALCLYRVAQEAVQNVVKHSGATHAHVELAGATNAISWTISDDGVGFDLEKVRSNGSLGLVSMRERVRVVHGQLSLDSAKGKGTRVEVQVPVPPAVETPMAAGSNGDVSGGS